MADTTDADLGAASAAPETAERRSYEPVVRAITQDDVRAALSEGLSDFRAAPQYGLFFGAVYALGGMALVLLTVYTGMGYLAYPLAAGFALIGPFIAVGLYEVSRRRETGEPLAFGPVLGVVFGQSKRELGWMAFVTLFVMIVWMYQVRLLLAIILGYQSFGTLGDFVTVVFTTPEGLLFLAIGNVVGALLSVALFSLTVVSFPLLLDRDVDFITAMITSVKAVLASPKPMLGWAAFIVAALVVAIVPFFLGLLIVLPTLGHATWRLYRRVVEPQEAKAG